MQVADASQSMEQPLANPFTELTCAQLLAEQPPQAWLLPGMLQQHEPAVIVGPSKSLKSSLAVDLGGALASGGKFLGQFAADRAFRVGFVGGDAARGALTDLAQRWSAAADVDLAALETLVWSLSVANLSDPASLQRLKDWIGRHQLEVVLIDVADLATTSRRAQAAQLRELVRCCLELGATPIVCCPTRKELPPRALGAADLASAADNAIARQWLLVNRRQAFEPGSGRHQLWLTLGGSAGQSSLWGVDVDEGQACDKWKVLLRDVPSIAEETAQLAAKSQIEHLRWKMRGVMSQIDPAQATKLKIREQSGMSGTKFGLTWQYLINAGEIRLAPSNRDPHMRHAEPRYRLVELAELNDPDAPAFDPVNESFPTFTTAELLSYAEKTAPPSPLQQTDQPSCSRGAAAEIGSRHDRQRALEKMLRESPLEKTSPSSPLEKTSLSSPVENKSPPCPVHSGKPPRKRRVKARKRRR